MELLRAASQVGRTPRRRPAARAMGPESRCEKAELQVLPAVPALLRDLCGMSVEPVVPAVGWGSWLPRCKRQTQPPQERLPQVVILRFKCGAGCSAFQTVASERKRVYNIFERQETQEHGQSPEPKNSSLEGVGKLSFACMQDACGHGKSSDGFSQTWACSVLPLSSLKRIQTIPARSLNVLLQTQNSLPRGKLTQPISTNSQAAPASLHGACLDESPPTSVVV